MFDSAATDALAKIRSDTGGLHWLVVRAADDGKSFSMQSSGNGNYEEFYDSLKKEADGLFGGIFKIYAVDNRGSVKSVRIKYLRITCIPAGLPAMRRAKAAALKPELEKFFSNSHLNIDTDDLSTLKMFEIARSILRGGGAHIPTMIGFYGGGSDENEADCVKVEGGAAMPPQAASKKPEAAAPAPAAAEKAPESPTKKDDDKKKPEAAAAEKPAPSPPQSPTKPDGLSPEDAWTRVINESSNLNWVLLTYDGKNPSTASVVNAGEQGLEEMKAAMEADDGNVLFGGLRVSAVDDRGSVKSVRAKFIFVQYVPTTVKPVVRAHAGTARGEFQKILRNTHISVNIDQPNELVAKQLEEKILASGGAHKPQLCRFGPKIRSPEEDEKHYPAAKKE